MKYIMESTDIKDAIGLWLNQKFDLSKVTSIDATWAVAPGLFTADKLSIVVILNEQKENTDASPAK